LNSRLAIIGFGDQARVVADILASRGESHRIACFVDLVPKADPKPFHDSIPVLASVDQLIANSDKRPPDFIIAYGRIEVRVELYRKLCSARLVPASLIHPSAILSPKTTIGRGSTICAGAILGVDSTIGEDVIVNTAASIDHDCQIGDHVNISPRATLAGRVKIGSRSFIGIGATIIDEVTIGENSVVAAGAVVVNDVPPGTTVMGVPARPRS
jgi:sugar O-acyltransferase (sialic acid O-acetyltransferase NeuD family)